MKCREEQQLPTLKENGSINVPSAMIQEQAAQKNVIRRKREEQKLPTLKKGKKQIQRVAKATRRSNKAGKDLYRFAESGRPQLNRNLPQVTLVVSSAATPSTGITICFCKSPYGQPRGTKEAL